MTRSKLFLSTFLLLSILFSQSTIASETFTIEGTLWELGTKKRLGGVNVFLLPYKFKTTTSEDGHFKFENVPEGEFEWIVNFTGYKKLQQPDRQDPDYKNVHRDLYLEKASYDIYETTVLGKGEKRDDSSKSLKASQFLKLPGTGGDPIKAVQNLPGVARSSFSGSQVIIQGSSPQDTRYQINGHEVPIIFHFGGLSSVVLPESLDRVEYLSAGYGAENGRAVGGVVGVWTKSPARERIKGFAFADLLNAGGMIEGPTGESSGFMFGLRHSYIGPVMRTLFKGNKNFNLTVAPAFSDAIGIYESQITPIDQFRLTTVASNDTLEFLFKQPVGQDPSIRGNFRNQTSFFRLIPELTHKHSELSTSRWSLGAGRDWLRVDIGDQYFILKTYQLTARGELERKLNSIWTSQWGFDNRYTWAELNIRIKDGYSQGGVNNSFSSGQEKQADINSKYNLLGLYWRNEIKPTDSPWTFIPALRGEYFSRTKEEIPEPRMAIRYKMSETFQFKAAGGVYAQPPEERASDSVFGNPDIKAPRANHYTLGAEKDFREGSSRGFIFTPGIFYKDLYNQVVPSSKRVTKNGVSTIENYNNNGSGKAYGLETLLKMELQPWTGWLSYTLSKSTRQTLGSPEYPFDYDQTHVLTAIAAFDAGKNWNIGSRFRYVTGNPKTPIVGSLYNADSDVYTPVRGPLFSDRLEPFYQLDVRVDKKWIYPRWIFSMYLDVQNVTNRQNVENIRYSFDYTKTTQVSGLPILPTLGMKGEF